MRPEAAPIVELKMSLVLRVRDKEKGPSAALASEIRRTMFSLLCPTGFLLLLFLVWRHNYLAYPKRCAEWTDFWLCQRCGEVSRQSS
jgi:hypothetical protein